MRKFIALITIALIVGIVGCNKDVDLNPDDGCNIKTEDPDGYLLKICQYLNDNKDSVVPNKKPDDYKIEKIEEGLYKGMVPSKYENNELIAIYLDCCYGAGDIAYLDKGTKEVIYFSPGDR